MESRANILVVDDEMGPRESLRMILSPYYNVYTAERGGQAVEILNKVRIDLATVDLRMPGLDGIKVLEKLKEHDDDIEAIIVTGYGSMNTAVEGLRLGAFDYVAKPFDVKHMLSLVERALERRAAKEKLKQVRSDFLNNITHELRTPLGVVIGFVSLLLDHAIGKLTKEQREVMEKVYRSSQELLGLIDNVLWLTYLNCGEILVINEEFDLGLMIRGTRERFEKILQEKEIDLSVQLSSAGIRIHSDPTKVELILRNLFQNAIKFTLRGRITVKAEWAKPKERVNLEIADTGIGIPEGQIEGLYQPFRQMDSSNRREFSGLGLGLAVTRQMVDHLGGTLEIKSRPGSGTRVFLVLPSTQGFDDTAFGQTS